MRIVIQVDDFEEALAFYSSSLGLVPTAAFESDQGGRVAILEAGRATLEIANRAQVAMIDEIEVGRPISPQIRVAFEVEDAHADTRRLTDSGATLIAGPVETPWRSLNSRLMGPGGVQLTLFEELVSIDERVTSPGFKLPVTEN